MHKAQGLNERMQVRDRWIKFGAQRQPAMLQNSQAQRAQHSHCQVSAKRRLKDVRGWAKMATPPTSAIATTTCSWAPRCPRPGESCSLSLGR